MATKKKNTVKDVKTILNDSKLQNYNTNFTISKKRNGGRGGNHTNGGTKQPTIRESLARLEILMVNMKNDFDRVVKLNNLKH